MSLAFAGLSFDFQIAIVQYGIIAEMHYYIITIFIGDKMTKIGEQFVNEFVSEVRERIEDDKKRLYVVQGISATSGTSIFLLKLFINSFIAAFIAWTILSIFFIQPSDVEKLAGSTDEIIMAIESFKSTVSHFTILLIILTTSTYIFLRKRIFRNRFRERQEQEQYEVDFLARVVEIQEELMTRHGLIGGNNDKK